MTRDYIHYEHKVRCVTVDSIYTNNTNRKFCTKYEIPTYLYIKEEQLKTDKWEGYSDVNSQEKEIIELKGVLTILFTQKWEVEPNDGNLADFLLYTYCKYRNEDRQN